MSVSPESQELFNKVEAMRGWRKRLKNFVRS